MIVNNSTNMKKPVITRSHLGAVLGGGSIAMEAIRNVRRRILCSC